jgi:hypothetical protein
MNDKKYFLKTGKAGFVPGGLLLVPLIECPGNADVQAVKIIVAPPVVVAPVVVEDATFIASTL